MAESPPPKRKRSDKEKQVPAPCAYDFRDFAPSGDIIFLVRGENKVRVHSTILKRASPVFAAMFGPYFKEGQALAKAKAKENCAPVEIALPEDDPEAFGWVCRALHCQSDTKLWKPGPEMLLEVWVTIEKYDMMKSMQLSVDFWIHEQLHTKMQLQDLWFMALFCFRTKDPDSFKSVTRQLVLSANLPFVDLASSLEDRSAVFTSSRVVYKLAAKLQAARHDAISDFIKLLYGKLPGVLLGSSCVNGQKTVLSYFKLLELDLGFPLISYLDFDVAVVVVPQVLPKIENWAATKKCYCKDCVNRMSRFHGKISDWRDEDIEELCFACFDDGRHGVCTKHKKTLPKFDQA